MLKKQENRNHSAPLRAACAQNTAAWENALVSAAGICYPQGTKYGTDQKKGWQCENKNKYG